MSDEELARMNPMEKEEFIETLSREMRSAAERLDFERAAEIRDEIERLKKPNPGKKRAVAQSRRRL